MNYSPKGITKNLFYIISLFTVVLFPSQDVHAQGWFSSFWRKVDAHELGTWNYLEKTEASGIRAITGLITANGVTLYHRRQGQGHDHSDQLLSAQCRMIQTINGFYRSVGTQTRKRLQVPQQLQWRSHYINRLKAFSQKLQGYRLCSDVPRSVKSEMYKIIYNYNARRNSYINSVKSRPSNYRDRQWATTLSAEIPGIPFKFEFLNGELKLKLSRSFAGIKFDSTIGSTSKRSGIKTVWIIAGDKVYIYEIGNRPISFEVPSSTINFNGDTVTITYR